MASQVTDTASNQGIRFFLGFKEKKYPVIKEAASFLESCFREERFLSQLEPSTALFFRSKNLEIILETHQEPSWVEQVRVRSDAGSKTISFNVRLLDLSDVDPKSIVIQDLAREFIRIMPILDTQVVEEALDISKKFTDFYKTYQNTLTSLVDTLSARVTIEFHPHAKNSNKDARINHVIEFAIQIFITFYKDPKFLAEVAGVAQFTCTKQKGSEIAQKITQDTSTVRLELYRGKSYSISIASTHIASKTISFNKNLLKIENEQDVAVLKKKRTETLMHEYIHTLGYKHKTNARSDHNLKSAPYKIAAIFINFLDGNQPTWAD